MGASTATPCPGRLCWRVSGPMPLRWRLPAGGLIFRLQKLYPTLVASPLVARYSPKSS